MKSYDWKHVSSAKWPVKRRCAVIAIFLLAVVPTVAQRSSAEPDKLKLQPVKTSAKAQQLRLLPSTEELTDADAVPLYQQAIQALRSEYPRKKFGDWLAMRPDELPVAEVKTELEKLKPTLVLVTQASRSRKCNWPDIAPGKADKQHMDDLNKFREITFILDAQSKIQIAEGHYEQTVETLTTMLSMAKQMGNGSTLVQGMTGLNIGGLSLKKIEQIVQTADSSSFYWALKDLKFPLVDLSKTMDAEIANLENYNLILRRQFRKQLEPAHDKIRVQMSYLDRKVAALECIEAIRLHAGAHEGKFPDKLSDITEFSIPNDPVTNKPFTYSRAGSEAAIELQGTEGSDGKDAIKYVLTIAAAKANSESVELKLYPAKVAEPAQTYRLIVPADKQKDADALPLYEQAIQLLPENVNKKLISDWMDMPLEQFPQERAEAMIQEYIESLRLVARASRCKNCNWPEWKRGMEVPNLNSYRDIAFVIRLWTRLEISRGQYESALAAIQTAFGMARHLGQAPTTTQTTAGVVVAGLTCREIERFVQGKNFPNLYAPLADLPKPFVNIEISIENEKRLFGLVSDNAGFDRMRLMAMRLDNHVNALQVVEAMRHYAATHDGQLPQLLNDIKNMKIPNDLMSGKAFQYSRTAIGATLRSIIPEGGDERDAVNYEIVIRK